MRDWMWDGPEDSDEEIEDMIPLKNKNEKEIGIKFSKNGIIEYIEKFLAHESYQNQEDKATARAWKAKECYAPGIKLYLKDGGSIFNKQQPFIRIESHFNKKF